MEIRFLSHNEIDKTKWDKCLRESVNSRIYALSDYLDITSPNWSALVYKDYEAIFPIPEKSKMGIPYVAHPLFTQQLGTFSPNPSEVVNKEFIRQMMKKFRRVNLQTNYHFELTGKEVSSRLNMVLDMSASDIKSGYNQNTKRNVKKFGTFDLDVSDKLEIDDFIQLKKTSTGARLKDEEWHRMKDLINRLYSKELGFFRCTYDENVLMSAVFFAQWKDRLYYLFSATNSEGMEKRASFGIIDTVIEEFMDKMRFLDFEGSVNENIARFFRGFGATEEYYYSIKRKF